MDKSLDARLEQLVKKVDILQTTLDRAIEQLNDDRKEISDLKVIVGKLGASVDGARDDINVQSKVIKNEVRDNLQPMPHIVSDAIKDSVSSLKTKKWFEIFKK